jgi:hypothetical protein
MTKQHIHIAALAAILVGGSWATAGAQSETTASPQPAMGSMKSSQPDPMMGGSNGHTLRGMNSSMMMMMGSDPVKMCTQMMAAVSRDPKLHQEMNRMMNDAMSKDHTK